MKLHAVDFVSVNSARRCSITIYTSMMILCSVYVLYMHLLLAGVGAFATVCNLTSTVLAEHHRRAQRSLVRTPDSAEYALTTNATERQNIDGIDC